MNWNRFWYFANCFAVGWNIPLLIQGKWYVLPGIVLNITVANLLHTQHNETNANH